MKALLDKNLSKLQKDGEELQKVLFVRNHELKQINNNLTIYQGGLLEARHNKSYLKQPDVVVDLSQYKDLINSITIGSIKLAEIKNHKLECEQEIKGLTEALRKNELQIKALVKELDKYGKIVPFSKPDHR